MQESNTSCKHPQETGRVETLIQKPCPDTWPPRPKRGSCAHPTLPMVQSPWMQTFDLSFTEVAAESYLKLLSTVAQAVKGQGTICWVDCGYVLGTQGRGPHWPARGMLGASGGWGGREYDQCLRSHGVTCAEGRFGSPPVCPFTPFSSFSRSSLSYVLCGFVFPEGSRAEGVFPIGNQEP